MSDPSNARWQWRLRNSLKINDVHMGFFEQKHYMECTTDKLSDRVKSEETGVSICLPAAIQAHFFLPDVQILASGVARKSEAQRETVSYEKTLGVFLT
jgi:hypothetical protein